MKRAFAKILAFTLLFASLSALASASTHTKGLPSLRLLTKPKKPKGKHHPPVELDKQGGVLRC